MSERKNRGEDGRFLPGNNASPGGRVTLTPELRQMKYEALAKVVERIHERIHDDAYMKALKPSEWADIVTLTADRCGLPRVTQVIDCASTPGQIEAASVILLELGKLHKDTEIG